MSNVLLTLEITEELADKLKLYNLGHCEYTSILECVFENSLQVKDTYFQ